MSARAGRKEITAWAMYDFANSPFYTSIISSIFSVYFVSVLVPEGNTIFGREVSGMAVWGYTTCVAFALVVVAAPIIGAICDFTGRKKRLTGLFCVLGCLATAALAFPRAGGYAAAAPILITALFCWQVTVALTNAFLPELAPSGKMNKISGFAWAMGYVGGALCLVLNYYMIYHGTNVGQKEHWVRLTFVVVGAWWLLFSIPFFLGVRERAVPRRPPGGRLALAGYRQVLTTLRSIRRNRELYKFLIAFMLINGGLVTVLTQAAIFGKMVMGMEEPELILVILMVQIVAAPGALAFGFMADRLGTRRTLFVLLFFWITMCVWAYVMSAKWEFWGLAAIVAIVMGGTQSVCRAAIAQLSPREQTAEYYGFFAVAGRLSEAAGTFLYPTVIIMMRNPRAGILSIAGMFVVGAIALTQVKEPSSSSSSR